MLKKKSNPYPSRLHKKVLAVAGVLVGAVALAVLSVFAANNISSSSDPIGSNLIYPSCVKVAGDIQESGWPVIFLVPLDQQTCGNTALHPIALIIDVLAWAAIIGIIVFGARLILKRVPRFRRTILGIYLLAAVLIVLQLWFPYANVRAAFYRTFLGKTLFIEDPANGCTWDGDQIILKTEVGGSLHPEVAVPNDQIKSYLQKAAANHTCTYQE